MKPKGPKGSYLQTITVPLGNYVVSTGVNDGREFTMTLSGSTNTTIIKLLLGAFLLFSWVSP